MCRRLALVTFRDRHLVMMADGRICWFLVLKTVAPERGEGEARGGEGRGGEGKVPRQGGRHDSPRQIVSSRLPGVSIHCSITVHLGLLRRLALLERLLTRAVVQDLSANA